MTVVGPAEAVDAINQANLTDRYSAFLRDYVASGIPDQKVLRDMGTALKVDGIFQGDLSDIQQVDGAFGAHGSLTQVTVHYVLLDTHNGSLLWEGTSRGQKRGATTLSQAAPLYEAIELAQQKILGALPHLGADKRTEPQSSGK